MFERNFIESETSDWRGIIGQIAAIDQDHDSAYLNHAWGCSRLED